MENRRYADDDTTFTLAQIEEILLEKFGDSQYERESGCYKSNGEFFSIDSVLEAIYTY